MTISLVSEEDVKSRKKQSKKDKASIKDTKVKESYKETKERTKNQDYRTYSLSHDLILDKNINLDKFFWKYNKLLNSVISYIYDTIEWKEWEIEKEDDPNYKQKRLYPRYRKDKDFKEDIRHDCLKNWRYSAHWINSIVDIAFSILDSWKKNYDKGKRKRNCPVAKRLFVRVKQTLMKIDGDQLRISISPNKFIYIDLSKRYFKIDGKIGEPILTPTQIHLPIRQDSKENNKVVKSIGWDLNKYSMDGYSPETGWIRIGLNQLHKIHNAYDRKRRRINKLASKKKVVGKRLKVKYSKRERNRCSQICHIITNKVKDIGNKHGFEDLDKAGMYNNRGKKWNRELGYTNWKEITRIMQYKSDIKLIDPYHTSKDCSRCGCVNKDLNGEKFMCVNKDCGLVIDRQHNAGINLYLKMEGLSHSIEWFDSVVLREFTQTGAERKEINELVRSLYDLMKPQFYGVESI